MGCWVRVAGVAEWVEPDLVIPGEVFVSENEVVATILGPDGEVLSQMLEREPIGYHPGRWRGGYPSSHRRVDDLGAPPAGPAPGAR